MRVTEGKATRLFIVLAGFFLTNALLAEFVGVKIFSLENTIGIEPFEWSLLGITGNLNFTAGVLRPDVQEWNIDDVGKQRVHRQRTQRENGDPS